MHRWSIEHRQKAADHREHQDPMFDEAWMRCPSWHVCTNYYQPYASARRHSLTYLTPTSGKLDVASACCCDNLSSSLLLFYHHISRMIVLLFHNNSHLFVTSYALGTLYVVYSVHQLPSTCILTGSFRPPCLRPALPAETAYRSS